MPGVKEFSKPCFKRLRKGLWLAQQKYIGGITLKGATLGATYYNLLHVSICYQYDTGFIQ